MKNLNSLKKGFTLVELIAVVAVILILVAIVVPRIGDLRAQAKEATEKANAQNIQNAFERAKVSGAFDSGYPSDLATLQSCLVSGGYMSKSYSFTTAPTETGAGTAAWLISR